MPSEHERLIQIRNLIRTHFDLGEVKDLCFDLGISYDDLPGDGEGKAGRVRELVTHCERNGLVEHLLALCQQRRPRVNWPVLKDFTQQAAAPVFIAPPVQNPRQIFVSHAHQDAAFAQRLAADLRRAGWDIWIAPQSIRPGERWVTAINRGLGESGIFLLVLTPAAAQSQWVQMETDAAIELAHHGDIRFIPLQLQPTRQPPLWRTYQWISFQGEYQTGWEQLTRTLCGEPESAKSVLSKVKIAPTPAIPKAGETRIWQKDGKVMVYVQAGEFLYGENKQKIHLDGFWIDKTPVTNAEYKRFLDANPNHRVPPGWRTGWSIVQMKRSRIYHTGKESHPVVNVSWHDAQAYAQWAGKRLPTDQEWEKAARGTDGREYPWGAWQDGHANTTESGIGGTSPVGQFSPQGNSPYGCVDMSGNVWEWTDSWWDERQQGCAMCGGSWNFAQGDARVSGRNAAPPDGWIYSIGFRCVARVVSGS